MDGAKAAVEFVSNCLSSGDLEALEESKAVSPECLKVTEIAYLLLMNLRRNSTGVPSSFTFAVKSKMLPEVSISFLKKYQLISILSTY